MNRATSLCFALIGILMFSGNYDQSSEKCDVYGVYSAEDLDLPIGSYAVVDDEIKEGYELSDIKILSSTRLQPGTYSVDVKRKESGWYEVLHKDLYLKTGYCSSYSFTYFDAVLVWRGSYGTLILED